MGCFSPDAPEARNLAQETADTLAAEIRLAPDQYAAEAEYQPKYARLERDAIRDLLLGKEGERGLLDIIEKDIQPSSERMSASAAQRQREADVAAVEQLGPRAVAAMKAANPQQQALVDVINGQVMGQLSSDMSPADTRKLREMVRTTQTARGLGTGPRDSLEEALMLDRGSESRRQARLGTAMDWAGRSYSMTVDPFMTVLGRPATSTNLSQSTLSQAQGVNQTSGPKLFDPFSQYASDLYNTNYNAQANANIAGSNIAGGLLGSVIGAGGSVLGGFLGRKR